MSLEGIVRTVADRLSLREPQTTSLERLHNALESVPALRCATQNIACVHNNGEHDTRYDKLFQSYFWQCIHRISRP